MATKPPDLNAWGRQTAKERHGPGSPGVEQAKDESGQQVPMNKHGAGYDNDVPLSSWLRDGKAEGKPGFTDKGKK